MKSPKQSIPVMFEDALDAFRNAIGEIHPRDMESKLALASALRLFDTVCLNAYSDDAVQGESAPGLGNLPFILMTKIPVGV